MGLKKRYIIGLIAVFAMVFPAQVTAGTPDPPGPPDSTPSYSLADLYLRLANGTAGIQSVFTEPAAGPGTATMFTLDEIMGVAPVVDDTNGGTAANVLSGKTYWGLTSGEWGQQTGAMPNNGPLSFTPAATDQTVTEGYYDGAGVVYGDQDLEATNIKNGVELFGVTGSLAGCYGGGGNWSNCSSTCGCQSGFICVDLRVDLLFGNDSLQECVLTLYPPPGLPIRERKCLNWASLSSAITGDAECQSSFSNGNNPYEYIIPLH